jgi:hypothetical protein
MIFNGPPGAAPNAAGDRAASRGDLVTPAEPPTARWFLEILDLTRVIRVRAVALGMALVLVGYRWQVTCDPPPS